MRFEGAFHVFGDDVDTDAIVPGRYLGESDPARLAKACFLHERPDFHTRVSEGDVLVAGRNFGCGSSREHAPLAILATGIRCVVAESFSRIFFRSAINIGLAIAECPGAARFAGAGDRITVDVGQGFARVGTLELPVLRLPSEVVEIIEAGGLVSLMRRRLEHMGRMTGAAL